MRGAIIATHQALVARGDGHDAWRGMGATLSVLWFRPGKETVLGHVGDSRIYGGRDQDLRQLSEDQNVGASMVRRGEMTAELASRQKFGSLLEQVMGGDGSPIEPQVGLIAQEAGVRFALCSDGLHGPLRGEMLPALQAALARPSLGAAATELIGAANAAGGPDNITVILTRLLTGPEA